MNLPLLAAALFLAPASNAAEPTPRLLSWQECVSLAGRLNPDLLSSRLSVEAGSQRYWSSVNGLLPRVSLSNRVSDSNSATGASRWTADGTASLDVFNLATYSRVSASSASLRRAEAALRLRSAEIRQALRRAFAQMIFAQEQVAVADRIRDLRRRNAELVGLKYASGRESKGNRLRSEAGLTEAEVGRAQAARALRVARRELSRRLGLEADEVLLATGTLAIAPVPPAPDSAALAAVHPAVQQSAASEALARAARTEARAGFIPSLSVSASKGLSGRSYFPEKPSWSASGSLSLPLFGGGPTAAYHVASAAGHDVARAAQDLRSARESARTAIETAWAGLADNADQLKVQSAFLEAARQRNEESSVRYSSGLMSFENWEQVVTDLVNFERSWVRARRDAFIAETDWDNSTGRALGE
ncbi:MAG: TolC family protein [Elusimicrobia bacterium]|nr:TolC family protein [Elusimicrobiota bacterium]